MQFLGGFYVFPGGTVHKDDYSTKALERCRGLSENDAQKILGHRHEPHLALGHWVAGSRIIERLAYCFARRDRRPSNCSTK
jgi:hypothetical protein